MRSNRRFGSEPIAFGPVRFKPGKIRVRSDVHKSNFEGDNIYDFYVYTYLKSFVYLFLKKIYFREESEDYC